MKPLKTDANYDDLCAVPDNFIAEILNGELYATPRLPFRYSHAGLALAAAIAGSFDRSAPSGWIFLMKVELHFGNDVLVPDLTAWRRSRLPRLPDAAFMTLAPDWICEVVSPSTEALDRHKKLPIYAREGVEHAWLLDPLRKTLEVLELQSRIWVPLSARGGDDELRAPPFDTIELELQALWT